MLTLTLPDGATRQVEEGTLPRDVVASIGPRLLRDALAVEVDGEVLDLDHAAQKGRRISAFSRRRTPNALDVLRHSGAHILATAVRRLRPDAKIGFGPAIEDGFYYDFEVERAVHAGRPREVRSRDAEGRSAEKFPFVREEVIAGRGAQAIRGRPAQARAPRRIHATTRSSRPTRTGRSSICAAARTCPTRRTSSTSSCCTRPARTGAATRSGRCCSASTPPRVLQEGRSRRAPAPARGGEAARSPPARRSSSTCTRPISASGPGLILWHPRGAIIRNEIENVRARPHPAARIRARLHAAHREREAVPDLRAPRELQGEHVRRDGGRGRARIARSR